MISSITVRHCGLGLCLWGMRVISVLKVLSECGLSTLKTSVG